MGFSSCCGLFGSCRENAVTEAQGVNVNNVRLFSYNSLRSATRNFHPSNKIGRGGFGEVYKGVLRDGTEAAIKTLSANSKQGSSEFLTEIQMISKVKHPNLVQLIGCCIEGPYRILVYEYLENNSLATALLGNNQHFVFLEIWQSLCQYIYIRVLSLYISGSKGKLVELGWSKRAEICMGTASALAFLHEDAVPRIVHRDIKASNILLDENFLPKIGDFGLAKLFPDNVTHVSTRVAGTMGYLAPEYALLQQLTKKADVYSFGVLILEIISGRSSSRAAFGQELLLLLEWTWKLLNEGRLEEIVDPDLVDYPKNEVLRFTKVALFCTQAASHQRPDMKQVVQMLSTEVKINDKLLSEPGLYKTRSSSTRSNDGCTETSSSRRKNGKQYATPCMTDIQHPTTQMLPR
ncbi:cold-responsive protein kinase 1 isoform X1 [Primulina huaijiensis]|uniref:cold-responsive protein kinase 1 isoform X1 n=2 Tax=Primulina huaijiensis TaxID=1492673 RepID=UPI003CC7497A